jgi:prepilin-type N-terminal cleavage/methylation domain-containing protein
MRFESIGSPGASRSPHAIDAESGFTLLETLTALAILAIALVGLFDAHALGLRGATAADHHAEARMLAQSLLADAVGANHERIVPRRGSQGRYAWTIDAQPVRESWGQFKSDAGWRLHHVRVSVTWDADRRVQLDTFKMGHAQ